MPLALLKPADSSPGYPASLQNPRGRCWSTLARDGTPGMARTLNHPVFRGSPRRPPNLDV